MKQVKKDPQPITMIRTFINQFEQNEINFCMKPKDWKKLERNNKTIALNALFLQTNMED